MFFDRLLEDPLIPPAPRSVFARIDQVEQRNGTTPHESPLVLLDCVDAEWLRKAAKSGSWTHLADSTLEEGDRQVSVIATSEGKLKAAGAQLTENSEWFHLELSAPTHNNVVEQFHNLFGAATPRSLTRARPVEALEGELLADFTGWHVFSGSETFEIRRILSLVRHADTVAIYDVGHGAATALLQEGVPILYFDLGGSVMANRRSFPEPLERFCFSANPPIVLSHWDWDHWASAILDRNALECDWILPLQSRAGALGAVHARFVARLMANANRIVWWDYSTPNIRVGLTGLTLVRAQGPPSDRNESGLAARVEGRQGGVLLPGDASLNYLRRQCHRLEHLMVPHHGGRTDLSFVPTPVHQDTSHLIYSYGVGNLYRHPIDGTMRALSSLWKKNRHTALRDGTGLGHVGISLTNRRLSDSKLPCGRNCQLEIRQWV